MKLKYFFEKLKPKNYNFSAGHGVYQDPQFSAVSPQMADREVMSRQGTGRGNGRHKFPTFWLLCDRARQSGKSHILQVSILFNLLF